LGGENPWRDHQQETDRDDRLSKDDAGSLDGAKVGNPGEWLGTETEDVGHPGDDGDDITRCDQTETNIGTDRPFAVYPLNREAEIAADANDRQAKQQDGKLDETDDRATIEAKPSRFRSKQKDE
jgi:hypothetical protein